MKSDQPTEIENFQRIMADLCQPIKKQDVRSKNPPRSRRGVFLIFTSFSFFVARSEPPLPS
jgi:hypothetical protein